MFEAYKIGVRISLINHASMGLALLSKDFLKTESDAQKLESRIKSIKNMMIAGGAMTALGAGGLALFKAPLEEARKYETEIARFKLFGLGDQALKEADKFARGMKVVGTTYRDSLRYFNEAQGIFRESGYSSVEKQLEGAKLAAPVLAKIQYATQGLSETLKQSTHSASLEMMRFVEMSGGLNSPARFNELADSGFKSIMSSGGNVDWSQYRQFMARGGVAAQNLDGLALFAKLEPIIGEMKGSTAGFALRTAYNRLNGIIKIPNQVAHELIAGGVWDQSKVIFNSQGGVKAFKGNPLINSEMFSHDPITFYEKVMKPLYQNAGVTTPSQIARQNAMYFGSTGGAFFTLIDKQLATIHKSVDAFGKAQGIDAAVDTVKGTLGGKEVDLHAKWTNLLQRLGETVLPLAVRALERLIPMVENLTGWIDKNHAKVKVLAGGFVLLSGALAFAGIVTMATGAIRGLTLAIGGLTRAAGGGAMLGGAGAAAGMSRLGRMGMGGLAGLKVGGLFALATGALDAYQVSQDDSLDRKGKQRAYGGVAGGVAGGVGGAYIGGAIGAAFGGIGAIPGALIGGAIGNWLGGKGGTAAVALAQGDDKPAGSPFIAQKQVETVQVHSELKIDGRTLAEQVSTHQARALNRPLGSGMYDLGLGLPPVGMNYAK